MNEKEMEQFLNKVADMRDAQQDYFKYRDKEVMKMAMRLEKEVDHMILVHRQKKAVCNGK